MDQMHKTKRGVFPPVTFLQGPQCRELLATPVVASKAGNRITNHSGDSGLDPFATKGITGTLSETQMVSEDDRVGKDNC